MTEYQLLRSILASQSIIFGQCGGARDGETFTIRTQTGSIPARAYGAIAPGQCVAYRVGGQWLAVSAGVAQRLNQYVLEFQRRRSDVPIPVIGNVVHLFVATESYALAGNNFRTGKHFYWLLSGDRALKVIETNEFNIDSIALVDKIIPELYGPAGMLIGGVDFWVLSDTRFLIQVSLADYTNYDGSPPSIKPQVFTALVDNWAISASDLQTGEPNDPITYPAEFDGLTDWLTPTHRPSATSEFRIYPPIVSQTQANYPAFDFSTADNVNGDRVPTRVQYVFRPEDSMGSSGNYLNLATGETYTTGTSFGGSFGGAYDPLELNAIEREWQVFRPNGTTTVLSPITDYSLVGTNYHTFTDTQVLFADGTLNLYYIPELRDGSFDAENELSGYFAVAQGELTGYPSYSSIMVWLAARSA